MKKDFEIAIASLPDRENLVAEIYYKKVGWVEISAEIPHKYVVAFCNCDEGSYWEFPFDEAMDVLQQAKDMLAAKQRTPEQQKEYDEMMERRRIELESKNNLRE